MEVTEAVERQLHGGFAIRLAGDVRGSETSGTGYFGASRMAPSRRMTSPFSMSFVTIWCTSLA